MNDGKPPVAEILIAIWGNRLEEVRSILNRNDQSIHINSLYIMGGNEEKNTLLNLAAIRGYNEILVLLLEHGANPSVLSVPGRRNALHYASLSENIECLNILLNREKGWYHKECINAQDSQGNTPLNLAARTGNSEAVKLLLEHDADLSIIDENGNSALHHAVFNGDIATITEVLNHKDGKELINSVNDKGSTPLHLAMHHNSGELTKLLLDRGAKIATKDNSGRNELDYALQSEAFQSLKVILSRGRLQDLATQNWENLRGYVRGNHLGTEDVKSLINVANNQGDTILHLAVYGDKAWLVKPLLKSGWSDATQKNNDGRNSLQLAAIVGASDLIEIILKHNPKLINVRTKDKKSPLYFAIAQGNLPAIQVLLERRAKFDPQYDNQAIIEAKEGGHYGIFSILKEKNIDVERALKPKSESNNFICVFAATATAAMIYAATLSIVVCKSNLHEKYPVGFWVVASVIFVLIIGFAISMLCCDKPKGVISAQGVEQQKIDHAVDKS